MVVTKTHGYPNKKQNKTEKSQKEKEINFLTMKECKNEISSMNEKMQKIKECLNNIPQTWQSQLWVTNNDKIQRLNVLCCAILYALYLLCVFACLLRVLSFVLISHNRNCVFCDSMTHVLITNKTQEMYELNELKKTMIESENEFKKMFDECNILEKQIENILNLNDRSLTNFKNWDTFTLYAWIVSRKQTNNNNMPLFKYR